MPLPKPIHHPHLMSVGAALLLASALLVPGCAAVVGVAGDVSSTAVDASEKLFTTGKAETFVLAAWEPAIESVRRAADNLALRAVREASHPEQHKLVYTDDRRQEVTVTVIRRTSNTTEIRVDVGLFGAKGLGQLTLQQILRDIPGAAATQEKKASLGAVD